MEVKIILVIAVLLISLISSIVKGLRKFRENRPGQAPPPARTSPSSEERPTESLEEIFRRLEQQLNPEKPEPADEYPPEAEPEYIPEREYEREEIPKAHAIKERTAEQEANTWENYQKARKAAMEASRALIGKKKFANADEFSELSGHRGTEFPTASARVSHHTDSYAEQDRFAAPNDELPQTTDDFRKMVVWSTILNRPYG